MATAGKSRTTSANGRKSGTRKTKSSTDTPAVATAAASEALIGAPAPSAGRSEAAPAQAPALSADEQRRMIAEAAYYRAQQRGFTPGYEEIDWLEAEAALRASNFRAA
jgi:hypothetical protein